MKTGAQDSLRSAWISNDKGHPSMLGEPLLDRSSMIIKLPATGN
jgi:hypothetical protein